MAFPKSSGMPTVSGTQVPIVYANKLLVEFYQRTVLSEIANKDYEGEIKNQGDTVRIRTLPDVTIRNYTKGQELEYEHLDPGYVDLLIDKGLYWAFTVDDVDKKQFDYDQISNWAKHNAEELKIELERDVYANIHGDVHATNMGATAGAISSAYDLGASGAPESVSSSNVLDYITKAGACLNENDVPSEHRWMVLPAWACRLIKHSDLKDASLSGDATSPLRNGKIGMIDDFTIYQSNLLDVVTDGADQVTNAIFGQKSALTFATQITESETHRSERTFGDQMRGLNVYGYKVVKPEAMGRLYITPA